MTTNHKHHVTVKKYENIDSHLIVNLSTFISHIWNSLKAKFYTLYAFLYCTLQASSRAMQSYFHLLASLQPCSNYITLHSLNSCKHIKCESSILNEIPMSEYQRDRKHVMMNKQI
jgi:hypothetical protein